MGQTTRQPDRRAEKKTETFSVSHRLNEIQFDHDLTVYSGVYLSKYTFMIQPGTNCLT